MSEILQLANFSTLADFRQQLSAPRCSQACAVWSFGCIFAQQRRASSQWLKSRLLGKATAPSRSVMSEESFH
jgi:hypothetical protein